MSPDDGVLVKARDGWWTVLVTDVAAVPLVGTLKDAAHPSPLQVTIGSAVFAVGAAIAMSRGRYSTGAVAYQASFLLDCVDGKLAKTRGVDTTFGRVADAAADAVRFGVCSAGLAAGLARRERLRPWTLALLMLHSGMRGAALFAGAARDPAKNRTSWIAIPATPRGVLASARRRMGHPGSTVDTELVAFTLAPALGAPRGGLALATLGDALHLLALLVSERRRSEPGD